MLDAGQFIQGQFKENCLSASSRLSPIATPNHLRLYTTNMRAKVDWDDKFRQYAKRKKWKFGRCITSEHIDTKDAVEKCNKTYGLRNIATGKKIDCSCGRHGTTKNYEEAAADEPCADAQSRNNGGAQDNNHQPRHKSTSVP